MLSPDLKLDTLESCEILCQGMSLVYDERERKMVMNNAKEVILQTTQ